MQGISTIKNKITFEKYIIFLLPWQGDGKNLNCEYFTMQCFS